MMVEGLRAVDWLRPKAIDHCSLYRLGHHNGPLAAPATALPDNTVLSDGDPEHGRLLRDVEGHKLDM